MESTVDYKRTWVVWRLLRRACHVNTYYVWIKMLFKAHSINTVNSAAPPEIMFAPVNSMVYVRPASRLQNAGVRISQRRKARLRINPGGSPLVSVTSFLCVSAWGINSSPKSHQEKKVLWHQVLVVCLAAKVSADKPELCVDPSKFSRWLICRWGAPG